MIGNLAHAHGEGSYVCRPKDVCATGGFCSMLHDAVVYRSHLVGMVAEVGVGACVIEGVHTSDEQCALMVAYGEWSAEGGAGFSVSQI